MMSSFLLLLLGGCLLAGSVNRSHGQVRERTQYPLPVFTKVSTKRFSNTNSTYIRVNYRADERPHVQWFVDDVPFVGGQRHYFLQNHFEGYLFSFAAIIVPGTRYCVCLQTMNAKICLQLRPVGAIFDETSEDVDFPWPLLVPVPRARYYSGRTTRIFAPELHTWTYTYSGQFVYLDPGQADQSQQSVTSLRQAVFNGTEEGQDADGDVITVGPVTSGSPGWMVEVATDSVGYEGMLFFRTTIEPPKWASSHVRRYISTRPITIFNRNHQGPLPENFVAMLPHSGDALTVKCRQQSNFFCLVSCPFVINGRMYETDAQLARIYDNGGRIEQLMRGGILVDREMRRTGGYLGEARFILNIAEGAEPGTYRCSVTLADTSSYTVVKLTFL